MTGLSNAQRDRLEAAGKFPKRVRISARAVGWYEHELEEFLADLPRGDIVGPDPAGNLPEKLRAVP